MDSIWGALTYGEWNITMNTMTKLREVMDEKGVTIAQIASVTGLDPKTVWHATQGKKIRKATRIAIAGYLKVAPDALFLEAHIPESIQEAV